MIAAAGIDLVVVAGIDLVVVASVGHGAAGHDGGVVPLGTLAGVVLPYTTH